MKYTYRTKGTCSQQIDLEINDDIITNVLGAIIGYFIFKMCDSIFKGKKMWNKFLNRR